eukprot:1157775-Pelagomonas_calceolata.AAC.18
MCTTGSAHHMKSTSFKEFSIRRHLRKGHYKQKDQSTMETEISCTKEGRVNMGRIEQGEAGKARKGSK